MSKYLTVFRVDYDSFIGQNELSFLLLTFGGYNRDVVPDNEFLEMLLDENYLLMQGHQKDILIKFINLALIEYAVLKYVVYGEDLKLD
jgi:hypothetical protein